MMGNKKRRLEITFESRKYHAHICELPLSLWSEFAQINIVNYEGILFEIICIYNCIYNIYAIF